jgi:hypothetical protein
MLETSRTGSLTDAALTSGKVEIDMKVLSGIEK